MNAAAVIVTYNRFDLLKECLSCVERQTVKFEYVVIVDNKCTDGTTEYLKGLTDKYHIVFEEVNGGGAKGFKDGVEYVNRKLSTDWILLIDDDAMLAPNYLEEIEKASTKFPECKAFSGIVKTNKEIDITHRKRVVRGKFLDFLPVPIVEYESEYFAYDLSSFCGLIFAADLVEKIGLPISDYFIWFDDTEYSLRLRMVTKIININSAFINHKMRTTKGIQKITWRGYYGIRNGGDVVRRYGTESQFKVYVNRVKIAMWKNFLFYIFTFNKEYIYNYQLYKDALKDLHDHKFGFNEKYHA